MTGGPLATMTFGLIRWRFYTQSRAQQGETGLLGVKKCTKESNDGRENTRRGHAFRTSIDFEDHTMKILAKSAVILSCVLASGLACAASIKIDEYKTSDYNWGTLQDSAHFNQQVDKSPFDALVHFTLGAGSIYDLRFNLSPTNAGKWGKNSSLTFELLSGDWERESDLDHAIAVGTKGSLSADLVANDLAEGEYTLHIFGKGDTRQSKYYVEKIWMTASPAAAAPVATVSEPGSYALLVGGLGLMGFVARRGSKAKGA